MADDIRLKLGMDIDDAEQSLKKFKATAEKALSSPDTKTRTWGNSLTKVAQNLETTISKMQALKNTKVPTEQYYALKNRLKEIEKESANTQKELKKLENTKVETEQYQQLKSYLESTKQSIKEVQQTLKTNYGTKASWTEEFRGTTARITELQGKLDKAKATLYSFTSAGINSGEAFNQAKDSVTKLEQQLIKAKARASLLESTGQKYSDNTGYEKATAQLKTYETEMTTTQTKMAQLEATGQQYDTSGIDNAKEHIAELGTEAENVKNQMQNAFVSGTETSEYKQLGNDMQYAVNQGNILNQKIAGLTSVTQILTLAWKSFKSTVSSLAGIFSKVSNYIKNKLSGLTHSVNSTKTKHNTSFKSMLTTVLKYGFGIRSIFLLYRRVRSTISTGLSEMSKQFDDVADDVYTLKNSWSGFKASLVSAFQPIFSYVVPALSTLINYLTTAMNTLANFFALLTGSSTYYKAVKGNESVADSVSGTGSAAEEANEELAEYDDLIVIDQDSSSGGSGGSGSSDSDAWNWEQVSVTSSKWYDMLMDALEDWDFTELGEALGDELIAMMQSIPWDTIYSYASNFGKGLATFLNGLISDDLFSELGRTIANALNTGLYFLNSFASWFDWEGLGSAISSGINSFIENYDLDLAVDTFNKWANGILTTLITAVSGVNWSGLADKIADGINGIDTTGIGTKLGKLVTAIANAVYDLVSNKDTWTNLGTKIGDGINAFFTNTEWTKLGQSINATFKGIITAIKTALDTVEWEEVGQAIADFISGLDWKDIAWDFVKLLDSAKDAIKDILKGANIDAGDITLTVAGATILLAQITGIVLAKEITKIFIKKLIETKVLSLLGSGTAAATGGTEAAAAAGSSLGTIATVAGKIAVIVGVAIAGWKIGGILYESATGNDGAAQGFFDTVEDLWDGLIGDNKIEFNLADLIEFTYEDVNSGSGWLKNTKIWKSLSGVVESVKTSWNLLTGQESVSSPYGYNGAPSDVANYIYSNSDEARSEYWSSLGESIITGIVSGLSYASEITNLVEHPIETLKKVIKNVVKDKFRINSPAKVMYEDGESIVEGILKGMILAVTMIPTYVAQLYSEFKSKIKQKFGNLKLTDIVKGIGSVAITITTTLLGGLTKLADYLGLDEALSNIKTKYKNMKAKLTTTLSGAVQKIKGTASNTLETLSTTWSNLKKKWSNAKATLSAYVSGQMSGSSDITNWTSMFSGLKDAWVDKSATVSAYVGGQLSNIKDINGNKGSWTEVYTNFKENTWTDATATVKANADVGGKSDPNLSRMSSTGDWTTTFTNFAKNVWKGTTATFDSSYKNSDTNSTGYKNFSTLYSKWYGRNASFTSSYQGSTGDQGYKNFSNLWNNWYGRTAKFTAEFEGATSVTKVANTALEKVYTALEKNGYKVTKKVWAAKGGVITGLTNLTDIMTGEAGAEAIVPLERNLGWLDKMAGMITDRLTETPIPFIANGNILPITDAFMKSTIEVMDNSKIAKLLESILNRMDNLESSNNAPIMIQLDGRTIAEVVWDETEKRYRQTGKVYSFA